MIKKTDSMIQINYNVDEVGWRTNFPDFKKYISKTVNETIEIMGIKVPQNISVSFFLTSDQKIKDLNMKYRKKNKATNVLSFPMQSNYEKDFCLGDIALANQILLKESIELKVTKYDYLCKMTIHGMLHLLGYNHETEKQFNRMNKYENLIFKSVKYHLC